MRIIPLLFILAIILSPLGASAAGERLAVFSCAYKFMGVDFVQTQLGLLADGQTEDYVTIIHYGNAHRESVTHVARSAGEQMHFWISQESPQNSIEVIVYEEPQKLGKSKMTNPHVPYAREMWAECSTEAPKNL